MGFLVVESIKLFKNLVLLLRCKCLSESIPSIIFISCNLFKLVFDQLSPVVTCQHVLITFKVIEKLPIRFLFSQCFGHLLLFKCFSFELCSLLCWEFNFLYFWTLLCLNPLELHSSTLVFHLGHCKSQIKLLIELLVYVVESKFNHNLPKLRVLKAFLNSFRCPNYIINLSSFTFLVILFPTSSKRQRDPHSSLFPSVLLPFALGNIFLLEWLHEFVFGHIDKDLPSCFDIFCLNNEALFWLNNCTTFWIYYRLSIWTDLARCASLRHFGEESFKFRSDFSCFEGFVHLQDLLFCEIFQSRWFWSTLTRTWSLFRTIICIRIQSWIFRTKLVLHADSSTTSSACRHRKFFLELFHLNLQ